MSDTTVHVTVHELCEYEGIDHSVLKEAVDHDIVMPVSGRNPTEWVFNATHVIWIRKAVHLRQDLDLDWVATALLIDLLRENERLKRNNQALERRLARVLAE